MMKNQTYSAISVFERITAPLAVLTAFVGGVAWLTNLNDIAKRNEKDIQDFKNEFHSFEIKAHERLNYMDERLARIEGKIDIMLKQK